jgi:tetratricopeptide (TPR) repeat protein
VFTGRQAELAELLAKAPDPQRVAAVVITAIDGLGGIGKTALAVHAAHRLAAQYPDGQLFIDLKGFTDGAAPVEPIDALEQLLRAVGVSGQHVPPGLDERAALWRSVLAGRRVLIVLDNAATAEQVNPLLPGAPGCLVVVTSRRRLAGLPVATQEMSLDMLPTADAMALFVRVAGPERLAAEPDSLVAEAVELCWRLPLAVSVAAGMLRAHPVWTVAHLVSRLRDEDQRSSELTDGPRNVTAVLDVSYLHLPVDHQRLYRLLSLHPGFDIDAHAAAALGGTTLHRARRLLDQLLDERLLLEPAAGRYAFHNLVRSHAAAAANVAVAEAADHRAAIGNLLDYYRYTAATAAGVSYPQDGDRRCQVPVPGTPVPCLADPNLATVWLDAELPNLLAAAHHAADHGWPRHAVHMSTILRRHLVVRGHYRDAEGLHGRALTLSGTTGDRGGELTAQLGLGDLHRLQGRYGQAGDHYQRALEVARTLEDRSGELSALNGLGHVDRGQGRYGLAGDHYRRALEVARTLEDRSGELSALNGLGHVDRGQGRYGLAGDHYRQALEIARAIGHRNGELNAELGLGDLARLQRRHDDAADHYGQALEIARVTRNSRSQLCALGALGDVHTLQARYEQAADLYRELLEIARTTGDRLSELYTLIFAGETHRLQDQCEQAADHYQRALAIAREMSEPNGEIEALLSIGRLHRVAGRAQRALVPQYRALKLAVGLGQMEEQARAHDGLAHTRYALRHYEWAGYHWQQAAEFLTALGIDGTGDPEVSISTIREDLADLRKGGMYQAE